MTSVGYGDIFPRNIVERVVCLGRAHPAPDEP